MYLYYNTQGELLEFINDKSLQQYNGAEYNKLYVYIADEADDGELPSAVTGITTWFERVSGTPIAYGDILAPSEANEQDTSIIGPTVTTITPGQIPYDRKRDLKHFVYGKTYQFLVVTMPTEVLNTNGVYAMSAQVIEGATLGMVLGPAVYTIKRSAILPDATITTSQFQYLLAQAVAQIKELPDGFDFGNHILVGEAGGAVYDGDIALSEVLTSREQTLSDEQKAQMWANLGLSNGDIVEY